MFHPGPCTDGVGVAECAAEGQSLPVSAIGGANFAQCKTNPPHPRPLTDTQLAVARWIVAGYGSVAIARKLSLNHHTIARWKRDPRMVEVIRELRARADAAAVAMTTKGAVTAAGGSPRTGASIKTSSLKQNRGRPPAARTRHRDDSDDETERMIARILQHRTPRQL
jgi:hypothetical protein